MIAPTYRNLDSRNEFLGLAMPMEFFLFIGVVMGCLFSGLPVGFQALGIVATYVAIRLVNAGRAPGFVQHWIMYRIRLAQSGGRLCAAARACTPPFPFGKQAYRDRGFAFEDREGSDG